MLVRILFHFLQEEIRSQLPRYRTAKLDPSNPGQPQPQQQHYPVPQSAPSQFQGAPFLRPGMSPMGRPPPHQTGLLSAPGGHVIRPGMAPPLLSAPPSLLQGGGAPSNYHHMNEPPPRFGLLQTPQH